MWMSITPTSYPSPSYDHFSHKAQGKRSTSVCVSGSHDVQTVCSTEKWRAPAFVEVKVTCWWEKPEWRRQTHFSHIHFPPLSMACASATGKWCICEHIFLASIKPRVFFYYHHHKNITSCRGPPRPPSPSLSSPYIQHQTSSPVDRATHPDTFFFFSPCTFNSTFFPFQTPLPHFS